MNCVVICCDTFRCDMFNHSLVQTPNLNRLAAEGIVFENAFAEGLPTIQARRSLFTGIRSFPWRFPMGSRGLNPVISGWHRIPDEQETLAEILYQNSVVTGLVADTYHMFKATQNFIRGFSSWTFVRGQEGDPVRSGPLSAVDPCKYLPDDCGQDGAGMEVLTQYLLNMLERHTEEDYLTPKVFRRACTWLEENRENAPWFLWIDSFAPHERWDPPMHFADAYYTTDKSKDYIQPQVINGKNPSAAEIERTKALYYGYVTFVDKWIGTFVQKLEQMGRLDDTAIIFTSDHGTELWDQERFGKGGDRLVRYNTGIPLIVRLPGGAQGGTHREDFAQHFDLLPTILRLQGIEVPVDAGLDGRDLLDTNTSAPSKAITAWGSNVSIRDQFWNLTIDTRECGKPLSLFDLTADPAETKDVLSQHPEVARELTQYLVDTLGPLPYAIAHEGDPRLARSLVYPLRKDLLNRSL